jgi:hypothetical protein
LLPTVGKFTSGFRSENDLNIPMVGYKQKNKTDFFRHPVDKEYDPNPDP